MEPEEMAKMEPSEVASDLMDELINYCMNKPGPDYYECMAKPLKDGLDGVLSYCYSSSLCNIDPEIEEAIENSDTFRNEVEKELKKMLNDFWGYELANEVDMYLLTIKYEQIADNNNLSNSSKAQLLQSYAYALEEFANTIKLALQSGKPLSVRDLYYWLKKLNDFAFEPEYGLFPDFVEDYYDMLDDNGRLKMLSRLLDIIDNWLSKIKQKLSELKT
ncbi:MAG: hypothetical protein RXR43_16455 [Sulfolobus sp.]